MTRPKLIEDGALRLDLLAAYQQRPELFEPSPQPMWTDPYISRQMLAAHLDPDVEAASRHPDTITRSVSWIAGVLGLELGNTLLDLGCGPGLYCRRFAERGLEVTGVDFSESSIHYAREHDDASRYQCGDYRMLELADSFDAVTLIYGDFCVLADADRDKLLGIVRRSLKPRGHFVFDVTTTALYRARRGAAPQWSAVDQAAGAEPQWPAVDQAGFWKPGPHLVLKQVFDYPSHETLLEHYLVIDERGVASVYHNWLHCYSAESITAVLEGQGFAVAGLYDDLIGSPHSGSGEWLGIVATPSPTEG
jgi:SAM-dependent methyltransferase